MGKNNIILKYLFLFVIVLLAWSLSQTLLGFSQKQTFAVSVFMLSVTGTLLFWDYRLSFALLGSSLLILFRVIDLEKFVLFASLEVILFLIGMMILLANLREMGFFDWLLSKLLRIRNLTAHKLLFLIIFLSGIGSCLMDEVSSIIFIIAFVFTIADYFEVDAWPFVMISVLATNIGSMGTVLGNPVGILIATKANLHFEDFMIHSFPYMLLLLCIFYLICLVLFRKPISQLKKQMNEYGPSEMFSQLIRMPAEFNLRVSLVFFVVAILAIAFHTRLEYLLGLKENTVLLITPLVISGFLTIWRKKKARLYVEREVEWWSILFFLFLFAQAGTLQYTGVTKIFASGFHNLVGQNRAMFIVLTLLFSSLVSSLLDNVVFVATFIPVIKDILSFHPQFTRVAWWALLYGACMGGNFTHIGSTANIVALGVLEKEKNIGISIRRWLVLGFSSTILLIFLSFVIFYFLPIYR
ncbi:MAG: hypothetical protein JW734_09905 [Candidatus Omnitrophica bacterium]|nr:hypothetical protein [Candidatus Omnitrophota bacterium]